MKQTASSVLTLLSCLLLTALTGCTFTYAIPTEPVNYPQESETLDTTIELYISDELRATECVYRPGTGDKCVYPLGPVLAANCESLARNIFRDVVVTSTPDLPEDAGRARLVPRVGAASVSNTTLTVSLDWELQSPGGNAVLVAQAYGIGEAPKGGGFTHKKYATERARLLLDDLFSKSAKQLRSSQAIQDLAK